MATATGIGFTVTVTVIGLPEQPFAFGVMVYTAVPGALPPLVKTWAIVAPESAVAPVTPV